MPAAQSLTSGGENYPERRGGEETMRLVTRGGEGDEQSAPPPVAHNSDS